MAELPAEWTCRACGDSKPIIEMVVIHRRSGGYLLRCRCKTCNNTRERGHRREWKRAYQRHWRENNAGLNESYWRQRNEQKRAEIAARAAERFRAHHHGLLIQGRLGRRGLNVSLAEAEKLLARYGPCYPSPRASPPPGAGNASGSARRCGAPGNGCGPSRSA